MSRNRRLRAPKVGALLRALVTFVTVADTTIPSATRSPLAMCRGGSVRRWRRISWRSLDECLRALLLLPVCSSSATVRLTHIRGPAPARSGWRVCSPAAIAWHSQAAPSAGTCRCGPASNEARIRDLVVNASGSGPDVMAARSCICPIRAQLAHNASLATAGRRGCSAPEIPGQQRRRLAGGGARDAEHLLSRCAMRCGIVPLATARRKHVPPHLERGHNGSAMAAGGGTRPQATTTADSFDICASTGAFRLVSSGNASRLRKRGSCSASTVAKPTGIGAGGVNRASVAISSRGLERLLRSGGGEADVAVVHRRRSGTAASVGGPPRPRRRCGRRSSPS
mmetsp:Transcript_78707/g.218648  ORF Transcript_78707/g.218648 Transcript_78707/m.218648 type:complete len:339 (-) Transcript_78707:88-1104(-)